MKIILTLLVGALLCSCSPNTLTTQTNYLNREQLASYHVGTPDPALATPIIGQRLLVHWNLDKAYLCCEDLYLYVHIRFGNREEHIEKVAIFDSSGYFSYKLMDEEFCEKESIATYKIEIYGNGSLILCRQHQLWVELIQIGEDNCEE